MHRRQGVMEEVDDDETKLLEVNKHLFGIIIVYIQAGLGMIVAVGLGFFLLPTVIEDTDQAFFIGSVFAAISVILAFLVMVFATVIYRQSRIIVTDRNITQVLQYGLFNRKVSQLNIVNVEDVTSRQNGLLATFMNYGTLNIETAGEQKNFNFTFCPNSNHCAKIILDARERMLGQAVYDEDISMTVPKKKMPITNRPKKSAQIKRSKAKSLGAEIVDQTFSE